jgi:hypothetical protein
VVRQLKRGEGIEKVLRRLGLSETTWEDARVKDEKLAWAGINQRSCLQNEGILLANSNQWCFNKLVKIPCHRTPYRCTHRLNLSSQSSRSCAETNIKVLKDKDLEFANSIRRFFETRGILEKTIFAMGFEIAVFALFPGFLYSEALPEELHTHCNASRKMGCLARTRRGRHCLPLQNSARMQTKHWLYRPNTQARGWV